MSQMIACPSCHSPIEVTEILRAQITAEVRSESEASARRLQAELNEKRCKLDAEKAVLESERGKGDGGNKILRWIDATSFCDSRWN